MEDGAEVLIKENSEKDPNIIPDEWKQDKDSQMPKYKYDQCYNSERESPQVIVTSRSCYWF